MTYLVSNDRNKNQYENIGNVRPRTELRPVRSLVIMGVCAALFVLLVRNFDRARNQATNAQMFYLNSRQHLWNTVSTKFLSFGLDTSLLRDMKDLPILDERFINLARHLAPAYVRIGGTSADCLYFSKSEELGFQEITSPVDNEDISNFTITGTDLQNLYNFAMRSRLRMVFDLNVLNRNENGSWNDSNAKDIISFAKEHNMKLDWQMGNEPNSFHHVFNTTVTATQLADDYYHLKELLNEAGYNGSLLVGPEVNHVGDKNHAGEMYAKTFLVNSKDSVNYLTWHQYYLNGRIANVEDFINRTTFDYLPMQIKSMKEMIKSSGRNILMWLSETSTAYGGGAPALSDRFVAGFLWLDKLGYSASEGLNVVTRQSLFGGNYAMIGPDITPNPDWWVSVVYKQFVSEKVLKLTSMDPSGYVRLYAHCTPENTLINRVPAITIYGVNIQRYPIQIIIHGLLPIRPKQVKIFFYALTSDDLQSSDIKMNGETLKLQPNGDLPPFRPVILDPLQAITLPPYSMVFIVIHDADVPACLA